MNENQTENTAATVADLQQQLVDLEGKQEVARRALDEARAAYGDAALGANTEEIAKASQVVQDRQQEELLLQAAHGALGRRIVAARDRDAVAAHAAKWDAFAEALSHRDTMFEHAEKLAKPFFDAVHAAIAASEKADKLEPVEKVLAPDGWHLMPRPFTGMANMKNEELSVVRNALYDMAKKSRESSAEALRMREIDKPGSVTQYSDPAGKIVVVEPLRILNLAG